MKKLILALFLILSCSTAWGVDFEKDAAAVAPEDFTTAIAQWKPLAEQGNAGAKHNLSLMHSQGSGLIENDKEAVKWFRLAVEQGDVLSPLAFGVMSDEAKAKTPKITVKKILAFTIFDNNRDVGTGELLLWAIGIVIAYFLARWWWLGGKKEKPLGKLYEILHSSIIILVFSFGLSFFIRLIGFVVTGESVSIVDVLLYTAMFLVLFVMAITYPTKDTFTPEESNTKLFWQRLLWWFSIMLGVSLAFVYFSPLDMNLVNVSAALFATMFAPTSVLIVARVFPQLMVDHSFPNSDTKDYNRALSRKINAEKSKDPNVNHDP